MADPARRAETARGLTVELVPEIMRWPGLPMTARIIACLLWAAAGGRPGRVTTTTHRLADEVGGIDARTVRKAIQALDSAGLVTSPQRGPDGVLRVGPRGTIDLDVADPAEAARARMRRPDPQREMWPDEAPAPTPPPDTIGHPRIAAEESVPIGEVIGELVRTMPTGRAADEAIRRRKGDIAEYVSRVVADPGMLPSVAERTADAVIEYDFPMAEVEYIANATRRKREAGEITTSPGAYYTARIMRACKQRGIPWPRYGDTT